MSPSLIATCQALVDGPWQHAVAARAACVAGTWEAFVVGSAPAAPLLVGRLDFAACLRLATGATEPPEEVDVELIPLWAGDNPDDDDAASWFVAHGMKLGAKPLHVVEAGPIGHDAARPLHALVSCRARVWSRTVVVDASSYSADVPLRLRRGGYGALEIQVMEILTARSVDGGEALPRPTEIVPMFSRRYRPRVTGVGAFRAEIDALQAPSEAVLATRERTPETD